MEEKMVQLIGETVVSSPIIKIMVVDADMNMVWCNQAHAEMFGEGAELIGKKCYETLGDKERHKGCPTCIAMDTGKQVRGLYDFGKVNSQIVTMPLGEGLVAKIMMDVPKIADGKLKIFE